MFPSFNYFSFLDQFLYFLLSINIKLQIRVCSLVCLFHWTNNFFTEGSANVHNKTQRACIFNYLNKDNTLFEEKNKAWMQPRVVCAMNIYLFQSPCKVYGAADKPSPCRVLPLLQGCLPGFSFHLKNSFV